MGFKPLPAAIAALITLVIWFFIPIPAGVTPQAWHLLALFIGVIAAIIGKAMPIGAIAFIAILLVAITGVTADKPGAAIQDALSSFANPLIWLIGFSIMISRGLIKTRLGARIVEVPQHYRYGEKTGASKLRVLPHVRELARLVAAHPPRL